MPDLRSLISPLGLLEAEANVPMVAYVVVALIGPSVAWALFGRNLLRAPRDALGPAFLVASASIIFALAIVVSLGYQTRFFVRHGLREAGTAGGRVPVMPETAVMAARITMQESDRWALVTPLGRCEDDQYHYFWLAFRLLPNIPDCRSPDIEVFFGVSAPADTEVIRAGTNWEIVRP
jgi:hypothetical protein